MRTVVEIADGVRSGRLSAREVMKDVRSAVEARNPALNAFWVLDWPAAMQAAEAIDARVARGEDPGPLAGVPFGVKDVHDCAGFPTSYGCTFFKDGPAKTADEPIIARARAAGAIPIGKTATAEFAFDIATRTKAWGVTGNPWNPERTPGGSSGGSAAAVAAGLVPFAQGADGGGSIRLPASYTGLVGLKPNQGRVGKPVGGEFTVHGVLTTTVRDTARLLDVVAGPAATDKSSLEPPRLRYEEVIEALDVRGLRAVWTEDLGGHLRCEPEVARITRAAAEALADAAGLTLVHEPLRLSDHPVRIQRGFTALLALSQAESAGIWPDHERARQLSDPLREYLELAARQTVRDCVDAVAARARFEREMAAVFTAYDLVLSPTTPYEAFPAAGPVPTVIGGQAGDALSNFCSWANLTYRPAISIPAGLSRNRLPLGLHLTARHHREDLLLRLARILEQARPWPRLAPMAGEQAA